MGLEHRRLLDYPPGFLPFRGTDLFERIGGQPTIDRLVNLHGARATDRRTGDPEGATGVRALNATALHYAARAGFLRTIEVLIEHGADPDARDSHGRTPLDWLEHSAPSVSRAAVRNLIAPGQPR